MPPVAGQGANPVNIRCASVILRSSPDRAEVPRMLVPRWSAPVTDRRANQSRAGSDSSRSETMGSRPQKKRLDERGRRG